MATGFQLLSLHQLGKWEAISLSAFICPFEQRIQRGRMLRLSFLQNAYIGLHAAYIGLHAAYIGLHAAYIGLHTAYIGLHRPEELQNLFFVVHRLTPLKLYCGVTCLSSRFLDRRGFLRRESAAGFYVLWQGDGCGIMGAFPIVA